MLPRLVFFCLHGSHVEDHHVQKPRSRTRGRLFFLSLFFPNRRPPPVKAAFVYVAPLTDAGWVRQHDQGRLAVEAALPGQVKTTFVENVAEGPDAERVIRDLAMQGNQIIFTPSFGYMEPTLKVAQRVSQA